MLMTQKQAGDVWCPHSPSDSKGHCLGSKCAAWRWKTDPEARGNAAGTVMYRPTGEGWSCEHCKGTGGLFHADTGETVACTECDGEGKGSLQAPLGYCGLAGPVELVR